MASKSPWSRRASKRWMARGPAGESNWAAAPNGSYGGFICSPDATGVAWRLPILLGSGTADGDGPVNRPAAPGNIRRVKEITIANCGGFWGDDPTALRRQLRGGPVDYLVMDYLAEVTMAILNKQRAPGPATGVCGGFHRPPAGFPVGDNRKGGESDLQRGRGEPRGGRGGGGETGGRDGAGRPGAGGGGDRR